MNKKILGILVCMLLIATSIKSGFIKENYISLTPIYLDKLILGGNWTEDQKI